MTAPILALLLTYSFAAQSAQNSSDPYAKLTPSQVVGREIWYKATAGNARYHTYVLPQKYIGAHLDWAKFLNAPERDFRFSNWGLINDPECCTPGTANCPAKSMEETFGFDWCPGDGELLKYVGRPGYRDPACDLKDSDGRTDREDSCALAFGTSSGVMGFRKFPNPDFNLEKWKKLNGGSAGTWEGMQKRINDLSIQTPFRIGMACGACHISFNPAYPPDDPNHPAYENILGTAGNQYLKSGVMVGSGMDQKSLVAQLFKHDRPGTVDTSAFASDEMNNPGTVNAILNFQKRPKNMERIDAWRPATSCNSNDETKCWCDPSFNGKCWERSVQDEVVSHFLKGGEDSTLEAGSVSRVYLNIGSCSEACTVNHTMDLRLLDPIQRGYRETPVNIAQCRRDCPEYRAIEDRVSNVLDFLGTAHANNLNDALGISDSELETRLNEKFGAGAVSQGRLVFARRCAQCHSTQSGPFENVDFKKKDPYLGIAEDWLGNDDLTPASVVGTQACRALHSNHKKGNIWEEFGSVSYQERPGDPGFPKYSQGGTGYYRNISLLNAWAYAPFMHHNAIGPEVCPSPSKPEYDTYMKTYASQDRSPLPDDQAPKCIPFDPSVEGRVKLFEASMMDLLNPDSRVPKIAFTDREFSFPILPAVSFKKEKVFFRFVLPAGTDSTLLNSTRMKEFASDVLRWVRNPFTFGGYAKGKFGEKDGKRLTSNFNKFIWKLLAAKNKTYAPQKDDFEFVLGLYGNCPAGIENGGHRFGEDLSDKDKMALTAFMETL